MSAEVTGWMKSQGDAGQRENFGRNFSYASSLVTGDTGLFCPAREEIE
jgi:hypothetical protein